MVEVSDRPMSQVVFILIRLLTHLAMLLGATKDPQVSSNHSPKWPLEICLYMILVLLVVLPSD